MMDEVFMEFSYCVEELRDFPNRDLIVRLTQLALENVTISEKLGNVVMAKLIHPQTLSTYKRPLYYVVDSILKKVGGPYPAFFQTALSEHFPRTVQDINEEDRRKLDFLFVTWEERQILSLDLLAKMRQLLKQQPVNTSFSFAFIPDLNVLLFFIVLPKTGGAATTISVSTRAKHDADGWRRTAHDDE